MIMTRVRSVVLWLGTEIEFGESRCSSFALLRQLTAAKINMSAIGSCLKKAVGYWRRPGDFEGGALMRACVGYGRLDGGRK